MAAIRFDITHRAGDCAARVGRIATPHGGFDTPAFMPVGTQAAVKGLLPRLVAGTGAQIILANTYHLLLRAGAELVARMGGLQAWMNWHGPVLTDSGGYQVFSLGHLNKLTDEGATFKSHLDGSTVELTPARAMAVQNALGADIIMALDDCPPMSDSAPDRCRQATHRTVRWLERCIAAHARKDEQALLGIVQGGTDLDLRTWCAAAVTQFDLPGYAIGGVAVGEDFAAMKRVVEHTAPLLPADKPRYLMGVGYARDIVMAVRAGVDMFDCVLPTRNGRHAIAFTRCEPMRLRNAKFAEDPRPIEDDCDCLACGGGLPGGDLEARGSSRTPPDACSASSFKPQASGPVFSRSYLRHLFMAGEMLGPALVSLHNLRHLQRLMLDIRRAISDNDWSLIRRRWPVTGEF